MTWNDPNVFDQIEAVNRQQREERREQMVRDRSALREVLEAQYGVAAHPKAEQLFDLAWDFGHANGLDEVRGYYDELVALIQ